ncbi:unnamed protein product, partial [Phaeothamnion confervicola]
SSVGAESDGSGGTDGEHVPDSADDGSSGASSESAHNANSVSSRGAKGDIVSKKGGVCSAAEGGTESPGANPSPQTVSDDHGDDQSYASDFEGGLRDVTANVDAGKEESPDEGGGDDDGRSEGSEDNGSDDDEEKKVSRDVAGPITALSASGVDWLRRD